MTKAFPPLFLLGGGDLAEINERRCEYRFCPPLLVEGRELF